jgi:5'-nucleotidase/5'-nucleotidase/UDP-sugar diphosphatase
MIGITNAVSPPHTTTPPFLSPAGVLHLIPAPFPTLDDRQLFLLQGDAIRPWQRLIPHGSAHRLSVKRPFPHPFRLKILHLNDLHGRITHLTPHGHTPVLSRIAWRVRHLRRRYATDPGTALLFLSAGDDMVGSIFDELLDVETATCHAAYHSYL